MKICEYRLNGANQNEISTEIKFLLATARFDGVELMRFIYETNSTDREPTRLRNVVLKVLRSMRSKKNIQFFLLPEDFDKESTEREFLFNKYPKHFSSPRDTLENESYFYIKV